MNKLNYIYTTLAIIVFLSAGIAHSQHYYINEYHNASSASEEWTEIIVVDNDASLANVVLRDNSTSSQWPENWQGGVKFLDIPFWRNIPVGTIIVINHRGNDAVDINPLDGYIEIDAENENFFEKVCYACTPTNWQIGALNIAGSMDIVQLCHTDGENIHALAHSPNYGGDILDIYGKKICYPESISSGESVQILPGDKWYAYEGAYDSGKSKTWAGQPSKGKANSNTAYPNSNFEYLLGKRKPTWMAANADCEINTNSVTINWSQYPMISPSNFINFLLVRIPESVYSGADHPQQGKYYAPGDKIGSGEVVYNGNRRLFKDQYRIEANEKCYYRLYVYRYGRDDILDNNTIESDIARGPAYDMDNFVEVMLEKYEQTSVEILTENGMNEFCEDDTMILWAEVEGADPPFDFMWSHHGVVVADYNEEVDQLQISSGGRWEVEVKSKSGIIGYDTIWIDMVEKAEPIIILPDGTPVINDTTVYICENSELQVYVTEGTEWRWEKDFKLISGASDSRLTIKEEGKYVNIASLFEKCEGTSPVLEIKNYYIDITPDPADLEYHLSVGENVLDQNLKLTNNSYIQYEFSEDDVDLPEYYEIISPDFPIILEPMGEVNLTIRFRPEVPGNFGGNIVFETDCDLEYSYYIYGTSPSQIVFAEFSELDFGLIADCLSADTTLTSSVYNSGVEDVTLYEPIVTEPFYIANPYSYPHNFVSGATWPVKFAINAPASGEHEGTALFPIKIGESIDTLKILLECEIRSPEFSILNNNISLTIPECENSVDETIQVRNQGFFDLTIENNPAPEIEIQGLPLTIKAGESKAMTFTYSLPDGFTNGSLYNYHIEAEPCQAISDIDITVQKKGYNYQFSDNSVIDLDTLVYCSGEINIDDAIELLIEGVSDNSATIVNFEYSTDINNLFEADFTEGNILESGTHPLNLKVTGYREGYFEGEITLSIEPCSERKSFSIKGYIYQPEISIDNTSLNFGTGKIPFSKTDSIKIVNDGIIDITIDKIVGIATPFSVDYSLSSPMPSTLKSGETFYLAITYSANIAGTDNLDINLITEPCSNSHILSLSGTGSNILNEVLDIAIDNKRTAKPGEKIDLRIVVNENSQTDGVLTFKKFDFSIAYDPEVYYPQNILAGEKIPVNDIVNVSMDIFTPGDVRGSIELNNHQDVEYGEFAIIEGVTMLNSKLRTELYLGRLQFDSPDNISIDNITESLIILDDGCALDRRLVGNAPPPAIRVIKDDDNSDITLKYNIMSEDYSSLDIYDSYGNKIRSVEAGYIKPGEYEKNQDIINLASGQYFVVLNNGNIMVTARLIVLK